MAGDEQPRDVLIEQLEQLPLADLHDYYLLRWSDVENEQAEIDQANEQLAYFEPTGRGATTIKLAKQAIETSNIVKNAAFTNIEEIKQAARNVMKTERANDYLDAAYAEYAALNEPISTEAPALVSETPDRPFTLVNGNSHPDGAYTQNPYIPNTERYGVASAQLQHPSGNNDPWRPTPPAA